MIEQNDSSSSTITGKRPKNDADRDRQHTSRASRSPLPSSSGSVLPPTRFSPVLPSSPCSSVKQQALDCSPPYVRSDQAAPFGPSSPSKSAVVVNESTRSIEQCPQSRRPIQSSNELHTRKSCEDVYSSSPPLDDYREWVSQQKASAAVKKTASWVAQVDPGHRLGESDDEQVDLFKNTVTLLILSQVN